MSSENVEGSSDPPKMSSAEPPKASIAEPPKQSVSEPPKASIAEPKASIADPKASIADPKASIAGPPKPSIADPKASIAGPPKPSIADPKASLAPGKTSLAESEPDGRPSIAQSEGGDAPPPPEEGAAATEALKDADAALKDAEAALKEGDAPPKSPEDLAPGEERKSTDSDGGPGEEKKKSIITSLPTSGKGAIATADKGAVELGVKVKNFFNAAEGQRLKEEAQKPLRRPKKVYQNSYRLESAAPYERDLVQKVMDATLEEMIDGVYYNSETAGDLAVKIAEKLRSRVLSLKFERYKLIVMTNIGPLNRQGVHIGFRCLFDQERDTYNTSTAKSTHAFVTAVIYAIYFE